MKLWVIIAPKLVKIAIDSEINRAASNCDEIGVAIDIDGESGIVDL